MTIHIAFGGSLVGGPKAIVPASGQGVPLGVLCIAVAAGLRSKRLKRVAERRLGDPY